MPAVKKVAPAPEAAKPPEFTAPANMAQAADAWWKVRTKRLAKAKEVEALEREEAFLKDHLIQVVPANSATGVAGKLVSITIEKKFRPLVEDWDKFYAAIRKDRNGFRFLNRAVNAAACKEVWEAGKVVPGVKKDQYKTLSYSARK